jgi:hypothetical protein
MNDELRDKLAALALEIAKDAHDQVAGQDTSERYPQTTGHEIVDAILSELGKVGLLIVDADWLERVMADYRDHHSDYEGCHYTREEHLAEYERITTGAGGSGRAGG